MTKRKTIGILGGGQLAKMLAMAAWPLGMHVRIMVKRLTDALPALSGIATEGDWDDPIQALAFAQTVDIVTLENEFVNPASLEAIEKSGITLFPTTSSIRLIQDKWHQKEAMIHHELPVITSQPVENPESLRAFGEKFGWPVMLKRRHHGYDGKGNATVKGPEDIETAWQKLCVNDQGLYAEAFCPFEHELAVMVTRRADGEAVCYPVVDTIQRNHICHRVVAPSNLPPSLARSAQDLAKSAVEAIGGIGTFGVEMFLTRDGKLLINELAPRVHNSGHYTMEGCYCSQFENHIRAILGLPLGSTDMIRPHAAMVNLLGQGDGPEMPQGYCEALAIPGAHLHIYGKNKSSLGRKMGHVTALGDSAEEAIATAERAANLLHFGLST